MRRLIFIIALSFGASCNSAETSNEIKMKQAGEIHKIIERAEKEYPGNYSMQKYEIERQSKALIEIESFKYQMTEFTEKNKSSQIEVKSQRNYKQEEKELYANLEKIYQNK